VPEFYQLLYLYTNKSVELAYATALKAPDLADYCLLAGINQYRYKRYLSSSIDLLYEQQKFIRFEKKDLQKMHYPSIVDYFNRLFGVVWESVSQKLKSLEMVLNIDYTYRFTYDRYKSYIKNCHKIQLENVVKQQLQAEILANHLNSIMALN
jgi:hypothetical protein